MGEKKKISQIFTNLNPLTLLFILVIVVAILTHFIPAGQYERVVDPATGKTIVQPGTYHHVEGEAATPISVMLSFDAGIQKAAPIIAFLLLIGGALERV